MFTSDSLLFLYDRNVFKEKGGWPVKIGKFLGEFDEVIDGDIEEFVSIGSKSYAIKYKSKEEEADNYIPNLSTITHTKGFRINVTTEKLINFDSLKDLIVKTNTITTTTSDSNATTTTTTTTTTTSKSDQQQQPQSQIEVTYPLHFKRSVTKGTISTEKLTKILRPTLTKRYYNYQNFTSTPWGWKEG